MIWHWNEPLSGEGAQRFGGRLYSKGTPALYTSLSIMTTIREANQIGPLQPTILVADQADLEPLFDTTDAKVMHGYGFGSDELAAEDWRVRMREDGKAPPQVLAERLIRDGYTGMLVRSFANGTKDAGQDWPHHSSMRSRLASSCSTAPPLRSDQIR